MPAGAYFDPSYGDAPDSVDIDEAADFVNLNFVTGPLAITREVFSSIFGVGRNLQTDPLLACGHR